MRYLNLPMGCIHHLRFTVDSHAHGPALDEYIFRLVDMEMRHHIERGVFGKVELDVELGIQ